MAHSERRPREIVEVRVGCCRHCYGEGHKYQRTLSELNHDREKWLDEGKPLEEFDEQGGIGFDPASCQTAIAPSAVAQAMHVWCYTTHDI